MSAETVILAYLAFLIIVGGVGIFGICYLENKKQKYLEMMAKVKENG